MAIAATYEPVATYTIPSNATASYTFNTIPQTYTDLVVVVNGRSATSGQNMQYQFNGNSSAIYSLTFVRWNGASIDTTKVSGHIMNYTNSSYYKAMLVEAGQGGFGADITAHLMQSTSPVTSLTLYGGSGGWSAGTTMTIYGILRA